MAMGMEGVGMVWLQTILLRRGCGLNPALNTLMNGPIWQLYRQYKVLYSFQRGYLTNESSFNVVF